MITSDEARKAISILDHLVTNKCEASYHEFENARKAFGILLGFVAENDPKTMEQTPPLELPKA